MVRVWNLQTLYFKSFLGSVKISCINMLVNIFYASLQSQYTGPSWTFCLIVSDAAGHPTFPIPSLSLTCCFCHNEGPFVTDQFGPG